MRTVDVDTGEVDPSTNVNDMTAWELAELAAVKFVEEREGAEAALPGGKVRSFQMNVRVVDGSAQVSNMTLSVAT